MGSVLRLQCSGGESRSHRKRHEERALTMKGLPVVAGRLDNEVQRAAAGSAGEEDGRQSAINRGRPDEVGRGEEEVVSWSANKYERWCLFFFDDPSSRPSSDEARTRSPIGRHQPRPRMNICGRASCDWMPPAPDAKCDACPGKPVNSTTAALCAASRRFLPDKKVTHLREQRQQRARAFVQLCQAEGVTMLAVVVRSFEPNGDCL